ncbi:MAG: hypothetical protein M3P49_06060 [Actinomycetota bacterium]|nr:hypothetical protein [Actinomycetota bacterium]
MRSLPQDLTGRTFGRLTVLERAENRWRMRRWLCECECGTHKVVTGKSLQTGETKSCGCLRNEQNRVANLKHGKTKTPEFVTWANMLNRCHKPGHPSYPEYGGKGLAVCEEWRDSFGAFLRDMGPRPSPTHSIDRIDGTKGYSPDNCRWATSGEQIRNRRVTRWITYQGETLCLSDWCRRLGINYQTTKQRLDKGWPPEKALTAPSQQGRKFVG